MELIMEDILKIIILKLEIRESLKELVMKKMSLDQVEIMDQ
jgi:hypothetical protein